MSLFNLFNISGGALNAQSQRLNTIASNLANADSATGPDGKPYRAKQVVFSSTPLAGDAASGVRVTGVIEDTSPMKRVHDPRHPLADDKGYVTMPNVSVVDEMVNMISASRSYQNNVEVMNTAKTLLLKTLQLGS
ncbi:MAG: flagellar basal body rod protein FlgC [Betaproteobacteria bacterium]|nr:flagellar basal body rod protein FlgC [Betaproteobacteria bacterium]